MTRGELPGAIVRVSDCSGVYSGRVGVVMPWDAAVMARYRRYRDYVRRQRREVPA